MKFSSGILFLFLATSALAAPQPEPSTTPIVLQNGAHAFIKNGQLLLIGPDSKQSPAPPGHYITRDGQQLNVESNGQLSSNEMRPNSTVRRNEQSPAVTPNKPEFSKAPSVAPMRPETSRGPATTNIPPPRSDSSKGPIAPSNRSEITRVPSVPPSRIETANDAANITKTVDPIQQSLYQITLKLQAIEAKQVALETELKSNQTATAKQIAAAKDEIIMDIVKESVPPSMKAEIMSYLKDIHTRQQFLPPPDEYAGKNYKTVPVWDYLVDIQSKVSSMDAARIYAETH
jgi:hypothetical protein